MTNFEKWKDTILAITSTGDGVAVNDGVPCWCSELPCKECAFRGACSKHRYEWLYAEYVEPTVNWTKVPIDTRILVRNHRTDRWIKRHFAGLNEDGKVLTFGSGTTSWTGEEFTPMWWDYAKLADKEKCGD